MENVANHLRLEVFKQHPNEDKDCFGRTAFNRYYYSIFLEIKKTLSSLNPDWDILGHAQVPDLLRGKVKKTFSKGMSRALKLNDNDTVIKCKQAISALEDLAKLVELGRSVRVVADYHPETAIDFSKSGTFSLNAVTVDDAKAWPYKVRCWLNVVKLTWRQVNV